MDEQEKRPLESDGLDLDDIMREFAPQITEDLTPVQEAISQMPQPEPELQPLPKEDPEPEPEPEPESQPEEVPEPTQDLSKTRRVPWAKTKKASRASSDTIAVPIPESKQASEAEEAPPEEQAQTYTPYKPIHFQPKDRLRSLKRKLVAGPEKRYYELSETGVGKVQVAMLLSFLVFFASAAVTAMNTMGYVAPERQKLMVFVQFFCLLLAGLLGCFQMMEGIGDLFKGRLSMNTLLAISFGVCCADGYFCFMEQRIPCCAAFSLQVTMSLWGAYHKRITEMGQMDTLRKASRIYGVYSTDNYYEDRKGLLRQEGDVDDFMQNYQAATAPEKAVTWYGFFAILACAGIGAAGGVLKNSVSFGLQVASAALLAAMPVTAFITLSRPQAILGKRLHSVGGVICGWQGVKGLKGKAVFAVNHEDLFPVGTCKLNGVKFFTDRERPQVISYACALVNEVGGALVPLFDHLLENYNGTRYTPENLRTYPNGGVGGEVDGESVLVGTPAFLKDMGVDIPEGIRVNQAVYIAIDGELEGLVAVTYVKNRDSAMGLGTLCAHGGLKPILTTGDFMLTEDFIKSKFSVNPRKMIFPERQVRRELAAKEPDRDMPALAITTSDNFASYAYCVTGARCLRTAQILGLVMHLLAGVVGIGMIAALAILGAETLLTPANMLLYQLVWLVPGLLLTEWTRHI